MEKWMPIKNWEGLYEVSDLGNVKSVRYSWHKLLKPRPQHGYLRVVLCLNQNCKDYMVHRLVAEAFITDRPDGYVVNHIDGNKANNAATNLEWVSQSENVKHGYRLGLSSSIGVEVRLIDTSCGTIYKSIRDASKATGINYNTLVGYIVGRRRNKTSLQIFTPLQAHY